MPRSDSDGRRDDFVAFRCDSDRKREAERRAEAEGVSLSEWMRQRLDQAADQQAATT